MPTSDAASRDVSEAQDLTQEFFARLLEKNVIAAASRERGRFRSFLLAALKNFLANEWDKAKAAKRGGGRAPISLDLGTAESKLSLEPAHDLTPERLYERQWALDARWNWSSRGSKRNSPQPASLANSRSSKPALTGDRAAIDYAAAAGELAISEDAARQCGSSDAPAVSRNSPR